MWISRGYIEHLADADAAGLVVGPSLTRTSLNAVIASQVPQASTSIAGRVRLASVADAVAGTAPNLAVTPAGLAAALPGSEASDTFTHSNGTTAEWVAVKQGRVVTLQVYISGASSIEISAGQRWVISLPAGMRPVRNVLCVAGVGGGQWGTRRMQLDGTSLYLREAWSASATWHFTVNESWVV